MEEGDEEVEFETGEQSWFLNPAWRADLRARVVQAAGPVDAVVLRLQEALQFASHPSAAGLPAETIDALRKATTNAIDLQAYISLTLARSHERFFEQRGLR